MAPDMTRPGPAELEVLALVGRVRTPDPAAATRAWERLDSLTKPPRSLGRLEEIAARVSVVQDRVRPASGPSAIVVCAADHGVVAEGVSAYPQEVTVQMVANLAGGGAAVNALAAHFGTDVVVVDVGVAGDTARMSGVVQRTVRRGTANIAEGPAMSRDEACQAFLAGAGAATGLVESGCRFVGTGEMGIGNTTAASALLVALSGAAPDAVVGRGTGIDDAMLARKVDVVRRALEVNAPDPSDPLGALASVGGLEIAAMAGAVVAAAAGGACAVADGFISSVAALVAIRLCPACSAFLFPSHLSVEPGHRWALDALGLAPVLELDMRLGEGTGAVLAIALMGAACTMMSEMATFAEAGVSGATA